MPFKHYEPESNENEIEIFLFFTHFNYLIFIFITMFEIYFGVYFSEAVYHTKKSTLYKIYKTLFITGLVFVDELYWYSQKIDY